MNIASMRLTHLILCGLAVCACDQVSEQVDDIVNAQTAISRAKESVVREQPDPAAAQFRDIVQVGDMVCGDLNGKNLLGAYVGFRPFVYREYQNGQTAWQTTGMNAFGIESRYVDGCLFPQANQCHADLLVSNCSPSNREQYLTQGFPADQLGGQEMSNLEFSSETSEPTPYTQDPEGDADDNSWITTIGSSFGEYVGSNGVCEGEYWQLTSEGGRQTLSWMDDNGTPDLASDDFYVEYDFVFDGSSLSLRNGKITTYRTDNPRDGTPVSDKQFPMRKTSDGVLLNGELLRECRN